MRHRIAFDTETSDQEFFDSLRLDLVQPWTGFSGDIARFEFEAAIPAMTPDLILPDQDPPIDDTPLIPLLDSDDPEEPDEPEDPDEPDSPLLRLSGDNTRLVPSDGDADSDNDGPGGDCGDGDGGDGDGGDGGDGGEGGAGAAALPPFTLTETDPVSWPTPTVEPVPAAPDWLMMS